MLDEEIEIEQGAHYGETNYIMLGKSKNGKTTLNFIYRWKDDNGKLHGKIGNNVLLDNRELPNLIKLLTDRLRQIVI
jgi:hypothetical protein